MLQGIFYWLLYSTVLSCNFWLIVSGYLIAKLVIAFGLRFYRQSTFPALVQKRREECEKSFNYDVKVDDISPQIKEKLFKVDLSQLREMIWSREVTSEQVLRFYFSRCKTIGRELNAAVEGTYELGLKLAKEADELIKTKPRSELPPLCGVPLSIKENYYMEGYEVTGGMETRLGYKQPHTAPLLTHLFKLGAVPFVRSNFPQMLMAIESENAIYGICKNPHDKTRSPGGSSGGEGALIAAGCSPAGLGNDIGGSIRIPCAMSGIFGFKPTSGRHNVKDQMDYVQAFHEKGINQDYVKCANGPMGRSVEDLKIITELMSAPEINHLTDRSIPPLLWRKEATTLEKGKKFTIGYYESLDDSFECHPAGKRAVKEVVEALKKEGHTLIPVDIPNAKEMACLSVSFFNSDGAAVGNFAISTGLSMIKAYQTSQILYLLPRCVRLGLSKLLAILGQERLSMLVECCGPIPAKDMFIEANKQTLLTRNFLRGLKEKNIDFLISPGLGCPAIKHHTGGDMILSSIYTVVYNFLGLPAGTLPVTRVRKDEQTYESKFNDRMTQAAKECMKDTEGLPVTVQVAAMPYKDEECLALMQHIESIMNLKPFLKI